MNRYIWSGVGLVVLAYALMALVQEMFPLLIIGVTLALGYKFLFKRRV